MKRIFGSAVRSGEDDSEHWMSVGDLMAGLMMVFLFISVAFMYYIHIEKKQIEDIAVAYRDKQESLYEALVSEFKKDLKTWGAEIDRDTLAVRFNSPETLFSQGQSTIREDYKRVLRDFFPRYMKVLAQYKDAINEVRIEGHTDSYWSNGTTGDGAYFLNMQLSQERTRSVLNYVYFLDSVRGQRDWIRKNVAAVGFSSSQLIVNGDGVEDRERSRRVTFRVITNAETQMIKIIKKRR